MGPPFSNHTAASHRLIHLSIRQGYAARPYLLENTVCGLIVELGLTRSFYELIGAIEEQHPQYLNCYAKCAAAAYSRKDEAPRFLREALK